MTLVGALLKVAYNLYRHRCLGWPLSSWVGLLLLAGGTVLTIRLWPAPLCAAAFGLVILAYAISFASAARRGYLAFEVLSQPDGLSGCRDLGLPLRAEEMVCVRASGLFTVQGKVRYFVDVEAGFQTTALDEHIIMGRVPTSRFLLIGHWPDGEVGWWYMFFRSAMIRELAVGRLCFGPRPQSAIRLALASPSGQDQAVFLAFSDRAVLSRVLTHVRRDAPLQRVHVTSED